MSLHHVYVADTFVIRITKTTYHNMSIIPTEEIEMNTLNPPCINGRSLSLII